MNIRLVCTAVFLGCFAAFLPEVFAQDAASGINDAGKNLANNAPAEFGAIAALIATNFVPLINSIAIIMVVISGTTLAFSQSQEQVSVARNTLLGSLGAIAVVYVAKAMTTAIVSGGGGMPNPEGAASGLRTEVLGIVDWITVPAATLSVLMIIISGIRAIFAWGESEGTAQLRRTVFAVIIGFTLIGIRVAIADSIAISGRPDDIIRVIISSVNGLLVFLGFIAVIVIMIAGIMMIVNLGNDDQYKRARDLIIRVAIGLLVIIASAAIINIIFPKSVTP